MTLKEKVAEIDPEEVSDIYEGGVFGCPCQYRFLQVTDVEGDCAEDCVRCWNREYKEATK